MQSVRSGIDGEKLALQTVLQTPLDETQLRAIGLHCSPLPTRLRAIGLHCSPPPTRSALQPPANAQRLHASLVDKNVRVVAGLGLDVVDVPGGRNGRRIIAQTKPTRRPDGDAGSGEDVVEAGEGDEDEEEETRRQVVELDKTVAALRADLRVARREPLPPSSARS